jgi:hypothetical protein
MTIEEAKAEALALKKHYFDNMTAIIPYGHCLEEIAHKYNFKDWNTMSAYLKGKI